MLELSLSRKLKCRKTVFMRVSGICFIKWYWFGSICGESNVHIGYVFQGNELEVAKWIFYLGMITLYFLIELAVY